MAARSNIGMRILVVDDDPTLLEICSAYLATLGHEDVRTTETPDDVCCILQSSLLPFDCLLVDIQMPGIDGIELVRRVRALGGYERTPILMITAKTQEPAIKGAFDAGATDFLAKPIDLHELRDRVDAVTRLLRERSRLEDLRALLDREAWHDLSSLRFEEPAPLPRTQALVDFVPLQNMLQAKTRLRVMNSAAVCFRVVNGAEMFAALDRGAYVDLLADIADTIIDVTGPLGPTVSYAGSGDFVVLFEQRDAIDAPTLQQSISAALGTLHDFSVHADAPCPRLSMGEVVYPDGPEGASDMIIERARSSVGRCNAA